MNLKEIASSPLYVEHNNKIERSLFRDMTWRGLVGTWLLTFRVSRMTIPTICTTNPSNGGRCRKLATQQKPSVLVWIPRQLEAQSPIFHILEFYRTFVKQWIKAECSVAGPRLLEAPGPIFYWHPHSIKESAAHTLMMMMIACIIVLKSSSNCFWKLGLAVCLFVSLLRLWMKCIQ